MLARALSFCNKSILFAECIRNYSKHTLRTKSIHYYTRRIPDFREVYLDCSTHSRQASGNYTRGRSGYTPSYFEYSGIHWEYILRYLKRTQTAVRVHSLRICSFASTDTLSILQYTLSILWRCSSTSQIYSYLFWNYCSTFQRIVHFRSSVS